MGRRRRAADAGPADRRRRDRPAGAADRHRRGAGAGGRQADHHRRLRPVAVRRPVRARRQAPGRARPTSRRCPATRCDPDRSGGDLVRPGLRRRPAGRLPCHPQLRPARPRHGGDALVAARASAGRPRPHVAGDAAQPAWASRTAPTTSRPRTAPRSTPSSGSATRPTRPGCAAAATWSRAGSGCSSSPGTPTSSPTRRTVFGRFKNTGAPLTGKHEFDAVDLQAQQGRQAGDPARRPHPAGRAGDQRRPEDPAPRLLLHRRHRPRHRPARRRAVLHRLPEGPAQAVRPDPAQARQPRRAQRVHPAHRQRRCSPYRRGCPGRATGGARRCSPADRSRSRARQDAGHDAAAPVDYAHEIYLRGHGWATAAVADRPSRAGGVARERVDPEPFWYAAGAAGSGATYRANREAFDRWRIVPRMLTGATGRTPSTTRARHRRSRRRCSPPRSGVQGIMHPDGELAVARVAAELGAADDRCPRCRRTPWRRSPRPTATACGGSSSTGPTTRRSAPASSPARQAAGLLRARRHARHLAARLAAARPRPRLPAVPHRQGPRDLLHRPGVPVRPGEAAGGGPACRDHALAADVHRHRPHLGQPRVPARALGRPDPAQGHPARRRRAPGRRCRDGGHRGVEPRRPPGRRRLASLDALPGIVAAVGTARGALRLRRAHRRGRAQGASRSGRRPSSSAGPGCTGWRSAARTACGTCCAACSPTSTSRLALSGHREPRRPRPDDASPAP